MAGVVGLNVHRKKKLFVRDGSGMNPETKRHFENVKQKMFAFVNRQQQLEADGNLLAPPLPFHPSSQRLFADQNKAFKPQLHHHRTPAPSHKHPHAPSSAHKQLPHLALATPQVARRVGM
jgi:hypothetical protein